MPVNAITISYLSQHAITSLSRTDPPGCAMYFTPLLCALSMLSEKGKNASLPRVTSCILSSHALFSSLVNTGGFVHGLRPPHFNPFGRYQCDLHAFSFRYGSFAGSPGSSAGADGNFLRNKIGRTSRRHPAPIRLPSYF